jgi:hypothetical protein
MPANMARSALENFVQNAASTVHHQTCTAKMGRDEMSVVDNRLKVYGIDNLRVTDGSILPRVTTGNTMAPWVIVGEKAARVIKSEAGLDTQSEEDRGWPMHEHPEWESARLFNPAQSSALQSKHRSTRTNCRPILPLRRRRRFPVSAGVDVASSIARRSRRDCRPPGYNRKHIPWIPKCCDSNRPARSGLNSLGVTDMRLEEKLYQESRSDVDTIVDSLLADIKNLGPGIAMRGADIERARLIPPDLVETLRSIGIFRMFVPRNHGGLELDLPAGLKIITTLSRIEASIGWIAMIGSGGGFVTPSLPRPIYEQVYRGGPDVIIAGSMQPAGTAEWTAGACGSMDGGHSPVGASMPTGLLRSAGCIRMAN